MNCLSCEKITLQTYNDNLCLFRALVVYLHANTKLEDETWKIFKLFLNSSEKRDVSKFQDVHLNDIPKIKDLLQLNIFLYDKDFVVGELIGELYRRSIQTYENDVKILRYNNQIITSATSITSTHCSKPSGVQRVTHFSQRRGIWNDIWLLVVIVLNIFTQRMFTI